MSGLLAGRRVGLLTSSASRLGGGVFEAVVAQAALLCGLGAEPVVIALSDRHSQEDRSRFGAIQVELVERVGPGQIGYAPGLSQRLCDLNLDCLHQHGIWMYPTRAAGDWARLTGRPYLISPHGMLDPWITARGRWKKALARWGYERRSWRLASAFHALTAREAADIAAESGRHDSLVIANAGPEPADGVGPPRRPEVLYLGRIHPKKNLTVLVEAWSQLDASGKLPEGARLTIAGWGESADVGELRAVLGAAPVSIAFVGPVHGQAKQDLLRRVRFLALPSLSEGLPMVVLEAWAAGTPVLMSSECNIGEGFAAGAAIDCGMAPNQVAAALAQGLAMPEPEWRKMAEAGLGLARGPFGAAVIASQWGAAYARLMGIAQ